MTRTTNPPVFLTCILRAVTFTDTTPSSTLKSPPLPNSETYLADLLRYQFSHAKQNRFCYIRCLDPIDGEIFQAKMIELIQKNCKDRGKQELIITQGCMKLHTWRRIMKQINTVNAYKLWRLTYWGENAGRAEVSPYQGRFHVLMESFEGQGKFELINLLYSHGHIKIIPSVLITPSDWCNEKVTQKVWEEHSN